jgi:NADH:ubiquinone oxidoreductase subunit D
MHAADLKTEPALSLREAAVLVKEYRGKEAHYRTLWIWATRGRRGIKLETVSPGGVLATTREALQRFFERMTVAREQRITEYEQTTTRRRSVRRREKDTAKARRELAANHGI